MATVFIDLQEGFQGESVTIFIDLKEVYHNTNVVTQKLLGFADHLEVSEVRGEVQFRITVAQGNQTIEKTFRLDANTPKYIGLNLELGKIESVFSQSPFGYA